MKRSHDPAQHPAFLPLGTVVGPWRVVAWAGRGVHGAVYRAVPMEQEQADPVALKLALIPRDPRFAREVELLSLMCHPSIPRLIDAGDWQHPSGTPYPYIAMEWVDGLPLYYQARQQPCSSQQVLQLLAQLARALQPLHALGAVHRDLKGDNVLVRGADSRVFLTDFGSGNYPGAATLTPPGFYPGTPAYRAPESWLFELQVSRDSTASYVAGPADDLYALGVTACRLVTGEYPEFANPQKDEHGIWLLAPVLPPSALLQVEPQLRDLILRMLSVRPEERRTAAQLAEALEQAAERVVSERKQPPFVPDPLRTSEGLLADANASSELDLRQPMGDGAEVPATETSQPAAKVQTPAESSWERGAAGPIRTHPHMLRWQTWMTTVAAGLTVVACAWWAVAGKFVESPSVVQQAAEGADQEDGGTSGLGEAASMTSTESSPGPFFDREGMAADMPPEPLPGQTGPDSKGRCPRKQQVALNRGCWLEILLDRDRCEQLNGQMFKGTCYVPIIAPGRKPTAAPTKKQ
jgi:serine/threonine protein kinase